MGWWAVGVVITQTALFEGLQTPIVMLSKLLSSLKVLRGSAAGHSYGVCEMQGHRHYMEDTHIVSELSASQALVGVFDGHGGDAVSHFMRDHATRIFTETKEFKEGRYTDALARTFLNADAELRRKKDLRNQCGSTATLLFFNGDTLHVGNVGDSRAVVCHKARGVHLTVDHKPTDPAERERIEEAGAFVCEYSCRINRLHYNLSRAVGDFYYKADDDLEPGRQVMSIVADTKEYQLTKDDKYIIVASDGLWDFRDTQELVQAASRYLAETKDLGSACAELCKYVVNKPGDPHFKELPAAAGKDNITTILVNCSLQL